MSRFVILFVAMLSACIKDETVSGYVDTTTVFKLVEISGQVFPGNATIQFPDAGIVRGQAPCNSYSAEQSVPFPWLKISAIRATRASCPELALEAEFFETLTSMTLAEPSGPVLILMNDAGEEMVFHALEE